MEIVFSPNDSERCVDITIVNDGLLEEVQVFTVSITPTDGSLLTIFQSQAEVTIISENSEFYSITSRYSIS